MQQNATSRSISAAVKLELWTYSKQVSAIQYECAIPASDESRYCYCGRAPRIRSRLRSASQIEVWANSGDAAAQCGTM